MKVAYAISALALLAIAAFTLGSLNSPNASAGSTGNPFPHPTVTPSPVQSGVESHG